MLRLILKDILVQKKTIIFALLYLIFLSITFQKAPYDMLPISIFGMTYILVLTACAHDDKNKSEIILNSIPLSKAKIVFAKYLSVLIFASLGILEFLIVSSASAIMRLPIYLSSITLTVLINSIFLVVLNNSIYLPIYFKFGYIKSRFVYFVLFFAVFFGVMSPNLIKDNSTSLFLRQFLTNIKGQSDLQIEAIMVAVILLMFVSSYMLSLKIYKSREI